MVKPEHTSTNRGIALRVGLFLAAVAVLVLLSERSTWLGSSARTARWEDSVYRAQLAKYIEDSTRIDSIAATIPSQRLESLYAAAIRADRPWPAYHHAWCLSDTMVDVYGVAPATRVDERAKKHAWPNELAIARMQARLPQLMEFQCGAPSQRTTHALINETNVDQIPQRPHRPR